MTSTTSDDDARTCPECGLPLGEGLEMHWRCAERVTRRRREESDE